MKPFGLSMLRADREGGDDLRGGVREQQVAAGLAHAGGVGGVPPLDGGEPCGG